MTDKHPANSCHVYPVRGPVRGREHDTESHDCWCRPTFHRTCDDCEHGAGCWKCTKGLIEITYAEAAETDEALVIVHNADPTGQPA